LVANPPSKLLFRGLGEPRYRVPCGRQVKRRIGRGWSGRGRP